LSGDAADELFGSYLSHRVAQPIYHFNRLYDKVKSNELTDAEKGLFDPCDIGFLEELFDRSGRDEVKWRYNLCQFLDEEKERLLTDRFKSQLNEANSFLLLKEHFNAQTSRDPLNRILEME